MLERLARITKVLADQGYRGALDALIKHYFVHSQRQVEVEITQHSVNTIGFQDEPKRWIVERIWTWLENARFLTRDYERLPENHEGMIYVVMIRFMLRRLTKNRLTWNVKTS